MCECMDEYKHSERERERERAANYSSSGYLVVPLSEPSVIVYVETFRGSGLYEASCVSLHEARHSGLFELGGGTGWGIPMPTLAIVGASSRWA